MHYSSDFRYTMQISEAQTNVFKCQHGNVNSMYVVFGEMWAGSIGWTV